MTHPKRTTRAGTAPALACLALVALLYHIPASANIAGDALRACLAAGAALGCLAWAGPTRPRDTRRPPAPVGAACLLGAVAAVAASLATGQQTAGEAAFPQAATLAVLVLSCLGTAVWEEVLFRRLGLAALEGGLEGGKGAPLKAACASSLLFSVLHTGLGAFDVQATLRLVQVFLFGLAMCGVALRARGLAWAVGIHALYDLTCFVPALMVQPAARAGQAWELEAGALLALETTVPGMAASLLFLAPAALWALRSIYRG